MKSATKVSPPQLPIYPISGPSISLNAPQTFVTFTSSADVIKLFTDGNLRMFALS
jgi:hypothetical protein